jgi:hypothetical protein
VSFDFTSDALQEDQIVLQAQPQSHRRPDGEEILDEQIAKKLV